MVNSWTLLRLNPQNQNKYVDHVVENHPDVEVYYPVYERMTRPHGKRQPMVVVCPVYPGYIFANLDINGHGVRLLVSAPIRARYIRFGPAISTIPDRVIDELRRLEIRKLLVREIQRISPYAPGVKVRIHTPIASIEAIIIQLLNQSRAMVDTSLGRVTVPVSSLTIV
jgi:transcription antitermination factor NusG